MPAELTRMSIVPSSRTAASAIAPISSGLLTSARMAVDRLPCAATFTAVR